ncbi:MAG TPA: hypothetical protein VFQ72_03235 [Candidatus Paceibacterota bacterium]|nr:hypothetical protein [Candidatus Paceibacterota bacterium]
MNTALLPTRVALRPRNDIAQVRALTMKLVRRLSHAFKGWQSRILPGDRVHLGSHPANVFYNLLCTRTGASISAMSTDTAELLEEAYSSVKTEEQKRAMAAQLNDILDSIRSQRPRRRA